MGLIPFSVCKRDIICRLFRHSSNFVWMLMTYMSKPTKIVEIKIKAELLARFAVVFDRWTDGDTHT